MQQTKMCMTCAGIGYLKIYPDPNRTICYVGHGQGYLPDKTFDRPLGPASASNPLVALLFLTAILIGCWIGYHQIADPDIRYVLFMLGVVTGGILCLGLLAALLRWLFSLRLVRYALWAGATVAAIYGYYHLSG
ncbi:MAG TPA: hypothetical protein VK035_03620 [Kiloniellales bacterium]|nr:hypothetical protein [Kiloniellales bacterium]